MISYSLLPDGSFHYKWATNSDSSEDDDHLVFHHENIPIQFWPP